MASSIWLSHLSSVNCTAVSNTSPVKRLSIAAVAASLQQIWQHKPTVFKICPIMLCPLHHQIIRIRQFSSHRLVLQHHHNTHLLLLRNIHNTSLTNAARVKSISTNSNHPTSSHQTQCRSFATAVAANNLALPAQYKPLAHDPKSSKSKAYTRYSDLDLALQDPSNLSKIPEPSKIRSEILTYATKQSNRYLSTQLPGINRFTNSIKNQYPTHLKKFVSENEVGVTWADVDHRVGALTRTNPYQKYLDMPELLYHSDLRLINEDIDQTLLPNDDPQSLQYQIGTACLVERQAKILPHPSQTDLDEYEVWRKNAAYKEMAVDRAQKLIIKHPDEVINDQRMTKQLEHEQKRFTDKQYINTWTQDDESCDPASSKSQHSLNRELTTSLLLVVQPRGSKHWILPSGYWIEELDGTNLRTSVERSLSEVVGVIHSSDKLKLCVLGNAPVACFKYKVGDKRAIAEANEADLIQQNKDSSSSSSDDQSSLSVSVDPESLEDMTDDVKTAVQEASQIQTSSNSKQSLHSKHRSTKQHETIEYTQILPDPEIDKIRTSDQIGDKLFIYHALHVAGNVDLDLKKFQDYKWVNKHELCNHVIHPKLAQIVKDVVPVF